MFVVAVTRWGPGLSEQLPTLAAELGVFPYDLRMRLNGPLPVVVARVSGAEAASALVAKLRGWGHGAVGGDTAKVPTTEQMHQPREFELDFEGGHLRTTSATRERAQVDGAEIYALIHAMVVSDAQTISERHSKQFSAARAVLSGGMVMTRSTSSTSTITESSSEERIYLIRRDFAQPMVFCQHQLRYTGLGDAMGRASHESFAALCTALRRLAPGAIYDDQLRVTRRKRSLDGVTSERKGDETIKSETNSNASGVDLAAYLILMGHARGQL